MGVTRSFIIYNLMARPKKYTDTWIKKLAAKLIKYAKAVNLPLKQEFSYQNNFASQRISEFCKVSAIFSEAIKRFEDIATAKWVLARGLNPAEKIFTLKNIASWKDTVEHIGSGETKIIIIRANEAKEDGSQVRTPAITRQVSL